MSITPPSKQLFLQAETPKISKKKKMLPHLFKLTSKLSQAHPRKLLLNPIGKRTLTISRLNTQPFQLAIQDPIYSHSMTLKKS